MRLARTALAHRNMRFRKRNNRRVRDEEPLIPGWSCGHPWYRAVLFSAAEGKCYLRNLELDPTPGKVADGCLRQRELIIDKVFNPLVICYL